MLLMKDAIFCDPLKDKVLPVIELTNCKNEKLDKSHFYLIGNTIYEYVGYSSVSSLIPGTICLIGDRYYVNDHLDQNKEMYNERYVVPKETYEQRIHSGNSMEELMRTYSQNYHKNNNLISSGNIKIVPTGEVYIPELNEDDDPLERIIKLMLRHMKLVLNDYRGNFDKKHGLDNIKSALNGATSSMSIIKFLIWCENFDLDWEITFDNSSQDVPSPIPRPIVLNNKTPYPYMDVPGETKGIFTVKCVDGEDPLKRGIKMVLGMKMPDLNDYKHKAPTPHLLNNMKSAIKNNQKMTLRYCLNWCEILDIIYSFKVINPKDGIWYKITGEDMTSNDPEIE